MNWFAVAVITLQVCAAIQYLYSKQYRDAGIWIMYACINVLLVWKKE